MLDSNRLYLLLTLTYTVLLFQGIFTTSTSKSTIQAQNRKHYRKRGKKFKYSSIETQIQTKS